MERLVPDPLVPDTTWDNLEIGTILRHDRGIDIVRGSDASSFIETSISPLVIG
jgi:hypothetical protein